MPSVKRFLLPDLGEGLTEAEIVKWLVAVGDTVGQNQPIVEVETAKAVVEIPAMWAGTVTEIVHGEGETVSVGAPIIAIDTAPAAESTSPASSGGPGSSGGLGSSGGSGSSGGPGSPAGQGRTPVLVGYGPRTDTAVRRRARAGGSTRRPEAPAPARTTTPTTPAAAAPPPAAPGSAVVLAKPPVRKLARDLGVDLYRVRGTGPRSSVTRDDVLAAAAERQPTGSGADADRLDRRVPVTGIRRAVAEHMVESAFSVPHVTEFLTVDVTRSIRAIGKLRAVPQWRDLRISPLLLVARAVLGALDRYPMVNSSWAEEEIVVHGRVNLGIAVATERGLIVPTIGDAGRLSMLELAGALDDLVGTARAGRTTPAAMTGGTFTITNVGVFGVDSGTPIIPRGQAAILAVGAVREAPWVHRGKIRVRSVLTLALSFDHRIVDGELGSRFLRDVGDFLTDPGMYLLAHG